MTAETGAAVFVTMIDRKGRTLRCFLAAAESFRESVSHTQCTRLPCLALACLPTPLFKAITKVRLAQFFECRCHFFARVHQTQERFFVQELFKSTRGNDGRARRKVLVESGRAARKGRLDSSVREYRYVESAGVILKLSVWFGADEANGSTMLHQEVAGMVLAWLVDRHRGRPDKNP